MIKAKIHAITLHKINQTAGSASILGFSESSDVTDFVEKLVDKIQKLKSRREFIFKRDGVEARQCVLTKLTDYKNEKASNDLALLLAASEKKASATYGHLHEIQTGNLLQVYFTTNGSQFCLLAKIDLTETLDEISLKYRNGLPTQKPMMKACLISFTSKNDIQQVLVSDSNSKIATYWYDGFLGLDPVRTDNSNTKSAFDEVENVLIKKVKKKSLSDYRRMRSGLLGYFRTSESIVFDDLVDSVFGKYEADSDSIDLASLIEELKNLPTKVGFDPQFDSDKEAIAGKRQHSLDLDNNLELTIKDDNAIKGIVESVMHANRKTVRIYTDKGYDYFLTKQ